MANWIATIAGVLSVASAALSWWVAREIRLIESRRDLRAQALKISSWTTHVFTQSESGERPRFNGVVILNSSDAAIFDVEITACMGSNTPARPCLSSVCPPGEYIWQRNPAGSQFEWELPSPTSTIRGMLRPYSRSEKWRVLSFEFTDGDGVRWRRDGAGRLTEAVSRAV